MIRRVVITTGARLHFGPLAVHAQAGRSFGGVGLMIAAPETQVVIERAECDAISGDSEGRISQMVDRTRQCAASVVPPCRVTVTRAAPRHAGLGSGTQLSLAVARGLSLLAGEPEISAAELARRTGRGGRSAVGTHGFLRGGLLVDAGITRAGSVGDLAARERCADDWRFLLATPGSESGLSGTAEQQAFGTLAPMPASTTGELCRIIVTQWLPAVRAADCPGFCSALDEFGRIVGEYFSAVQGGIYAHRRMSLLARDLHERGIRGVAQSSWGPTIAACCENESLALQLQSDLTAAPQWRDCRFCVVRPLNAGARIDVEA